MNIKILSLLANLYERIAPRKSWVCQFINDIASRSASVTIHHQKVFSKYKGIYKNRDIVIVGCGPSVNNYDPNLHNDAIKIGINMSYKKNIFYDYMFVTDYYYGPDFKWLNDFFNYRGSECQKFYGIIPQNARHKYCNVMPLSFSILPAVDYYYFDPIAWCRLPYDISLEPFSFFPATVFSALQFALFTMPKNIFLVGFDCSKNHFYSLNDNISLSGQIKYFKIFKKLYENQYPTTKIISINPVGLKGIFDEDIYTS